MAVKTIVSLWPCKKRKRSDAYRKKSNSGEETHVPGERDGEMR